MTEIIRVNVREARTRCQAGSRLVCAYDSEEAFEKNHLEGAISLNQLRNPASHVSQEDEIIFYCA